MAAVVSADDPHAHWCGLCGQRFEFVGGIYRFLGRGRLPWSDRWLDRPRAAESPRTGPESAPDYYRRLPFVRKDDPRAGEWRIRRQSFARLQHDGLPGVWEGLIRILDLGAGSGWLSHRLASFGHSVVALDREDGDVDGLGACRYYPTAFPAIQADFNALPFLDGEFDVVILNASLHCSATPLDTLVEARRVLTAGGRLVVMDSPLFEERTDGQAMLDAGADCGFLTFDDLRRAASRLGLNGRFFRSTGPWRWRVARAFADWREGRRSPTFGLWVAD